MRPCALYLEQAQSCAFQECRKLLCMASTDVTPPDSHNAWTAPMNIIHTYTIRTRDVDRTVTQYG
ncbi:hypothetical protein T05_1938 [Trichinella murrelli]|uniref:Uncharacterized protein n=1 Tax=Trichinella murrelli TaxID=144512 RepID=A0A0V0TI23_9BILA|nr:hypothetical protein T05_1938 [Trichinella murrelli]